MVKLKKGDFVEVEYIGMLKEDKTIFDTTDEKKAKELQIHNSHVVYGPVAICLGEHQVIKGIDDFLIGKDTEQRYSFEVKPEDSFGRKNPKLLKIVSSTMFRKQQIQPMVGLQVNVDGILGTIRSVTGGRVVLDFNHPLSGRELIYEVTVHDVVLDKKKQLESYLRVSLGLKDLEVALENDVAQVTVSSELPKEIQEKLRKKCIALVSIQKIEFVTKEAKKEMPEDLPQEPIPKEEPVPEKA